MWGETMVSISDGKPGHGEGFAQTIKQCQQGRRQVPATGPQQAVMPPEAKLIDAQFKGFELKAGGHIAQLGQPCFRNFAKKGQGQVDGFHPGWLAA